MTTARPYRRAISVADALDELERHAGTQFDPAVVAAFARVFAERGAARPAVAGARGRGPGRSRGRRGGARSPADPWQTPSSTRSPPTTAETGSGRLRPARARAPPGRRDPYRRRSHGRALGPQREGEGQDRRHHLVPRPTAAKSWAAGGAQQQHRLGHRDTPRDEQEPCPSSASMYWTARYVAGEHGERHPQHHQRIGRFRLILEAPNAASISGGSRSRR